MKLIIQIPCLNEEAQLPATLADLPRSLPGVDIVEWMVIDDGSTDRTIAVAIEHGVDHIVRLPQNRGLATAFQAGLDACLKLGADVIVNTDADNQYRADSIPDLVAPVVEGEADLVIGDREVGSVEDFSALKKRLQVFGSSVVRRASGTDVVDATSGFRAYSKEAALQLTVVSPYTYTIESIIQAGKSRNSVASVKIGTNPMTRESRLFGSTWGYIRRNALTIVRVYAAYEPLRFFGMIAAAMALAGSLSYLPFLLDWLLNGDTTGHLQSIILGSALLIAAIQVLSLAVVADLVGSNRAVSQRTLERVRRLELAMSVAPSHYHHAASPDRVLSEDARHANE